MYEIVVGRSEQDRKKLGLRGSVLLGKQYVEMGRTTSLSTDVFMDVNRSHVVFVAGKKGSGKSYCLSAIAEGIMELDSEIRQNISMILFDTMGVFWTMKFPNTKDSELLKKWNIKPRGMDVQIFTPIGVFEKYKNEGVPTDFPLSIRPSELDADDWCSSFGIDRNSEIGVLIEKVINFLLENKSNYSVDDIIDAVKDDLKTEEKVKDAVINRFENAKKWGLFDVRGTEIKDIAIGGKISVIDASAYAILPNGWAIKSLLIGLIAKKLFIERMKVRRGEEFEQLKSLQSYFKEEEVSKEKKEPLVWLMIDEAHEFLPNRGSTTATLPLITILREGRQPGISMALATQQPGKIHTDVMTQSDIILGMRLTAKVDTDALQQLAQSFMREGIESSINKLPRVPGASVLIDDQNERVFSIQVRPKATWHGGEAPSAMVELKEIEKSL